MPICFGGNSFIKKQIPHSLDNIPPAPESSFFRKGHGQQILRGPAPTRIHRRSGSLSLLTSTRGYASMPPGNLDRRDTLLPAFPSRRQGP